MSTIKTNTIENVAGTISLPVSDIASGLIGINQTWQDVTASRVAGVVYTNDTGKPIQVIVNSINATVVTITVGGMQIADASSAAAGTNSTISFIVPNQATYQVSALGTFWSELR